MYGDLLLLEHDDQPVMRAERLAFGETSGRNEAWLRDTLLSHPDLLPIRDIDASYGPLIPLCRELNTPGGRIDCTFINQNGLLTLVECKLWRNPEARRKVVAQVLDYARALSQWSYSDLQRQVASATGRKGNVPYDIVSQYHRDLVEQNFIDSAARSMRAGRFLLLIAGDGIREDVGAMAELINRNAALSFSFGLVEIALYGLDNGGVAIQPRTVARTKLIERTVVLVRDATGTATAVDEEFMAPQQVEAADLAINPLGESPKQAEYRKWWQAVIDSPLDDPDQEPPKLYWPNYLRAALPWPNTWIWIYRAGGAEGSVGVCIHGRKGADQELLNALSPEKTAILAELPPGSEYRGFDKDPSRYTYTAVKRQNEFRDDVEMKSWLADTINKFVNAIRPRAERAFRRKSEY